MKYTKKIYKMVCYIMIIMCLTACTKPNENEVKDNATQVQISESVGTEMHDTAQENEPVSSADENGKDEETGSAMNTLLDNTTGSGDEDNALPEAEVKKNSASDNTNNTPDVAQESPSDIKDDDNEGDRNHDEDDKPKTEEDNGKHNNEDEGDAQEDAMTTPTPTPVDNGVIRDENGNILLPEAP